MKNSQKLFSNERQDKWWLSSLLVVLGFSIFLKIEGLSRDITTLIDQGIEIQSKAPYYFYSNLYN